MPFPSWIVMFVNADKFGGYVRAGVAGGLSQLVLSYPPVAEYLTPTEQGLISAAVAGLAVGIWSHIAKSVADNSAPRTPIGMRSGGAIGSAIIAFFLCYGHAFAQSALPVKAPPLLPANCISQMSCTGFYLGGVVYGIGGNAAILQNGINNSVFAGGGDLGLNAGWQYWDGKYFVGLDIDGLLESQNNAGVTRFAGANGGFVGIIHAKFGGNLVGLLANAPTPPTTPNVLLGAIMATYIDECAAFRKGGTQWCGGAGTEFMLAPKVTLDLVYDYGAPTNNFKALQNVGAKIAYHF